MFSKSISLTSVFLKLPSIRLRADELTKEKFSDFFIQFKEDDIIKNIELKEVDLGNKTIVLGLVN